MQQSMSLEYEPASEHISVKQLFVGLFATEPKCAEGERDEVAAPHLESPRSRVPDFVSSAHEASMAAALTSLRLSPNAWRAGGMTSVCLLSTCSLKFRCVRVVQSLSMSGFPIPSCLRMLVCLVIHDYG
jgi:hypothetical protein